MSVAQLDVALDRPLPQSPDAERAVLGSILINNHAFYRVVSTINTEDFFRDAHRTIFATMRRLAEQSREIDLLTLREELAKNAQLEQVGGTAYVASLIDGIPDIANVERYAHIVKEKSTLRRLIVMGNSVMRAALDSPGEPADVLNIAEKSIYEIAEGSIEKGFVALDRITRSNMTAIEQLQHAGKLITGIPTGYDRFNEFTSGFQAQDLIIIAARPSMGKAQPLDAAVLTPSGWATMGSLSVGDSVASIDGENSIVTGVYPQGERQVYRITFSDGRSAEACSEHLWQVSYREWASPRVMPTSELIERLKRKRYQSRLSVELFSGDFGSGEECAVPIKPWLLGFLLGDGALTGSSVMFSSADDELVERVRTDVGPGFKIVKSGGYDYRITQSDKGSYPFGSPPPNLIRKSLEDLGVWGCQAHEKFIPKQYLTASKSVRARVLEGLLDTDGWVEKLGSVCFSSSSERLARDVIELVRSLGGTAKLRRKATSYTYQGERRDGRTAFLCTLSLPYDVIALVSRKQIRRSADARRRRLTITSITPSRVCPTQCIRVSHPSHMYITDGYVATHNTSFMMNMAESIAIPDRSGDPRPPSQRLYAVGVFSLEMSKEQIGLRILSSESGVSNHLIRAGMLSERNWRDLADASARLAKAKIFIDDTPGIDIMEMRAKARRLKMEAGLDMIMVDYLQLMSVKGKVESRNQEVSQISRGLKAIAKELNVPLIALSQLSRRPEQRTGDHRPQLSDLRESGSIEQDADVVCFIYRDEVYNKDTEEKGIAEIIIGKQRNGPIGDFKLVFRNDITKFFNYEPTPDYGPQ
ncbi:MAG: replicative helicase [Thermoanaerobaculia bacterium]|jgi:replicative DNA helicase|nr:replicative helicase [Thermoanaerobaculia bacterium]